MSFRIDKLLFWTHIIRYLNEMESIWILYLLFRYNCSNEHGFRYAQYTKDPDMERDIIMYIEGEISHYLNGLVSRNMALMIFDY